MSPSATFNRAELDSAFQALHALSTALKTQVDNLLDQYAKAQGFLYSSRVKGVSSYLEKLDSGRWESAALDDVFAASLVVITMSDIDRCIDGLPPRIVVKQRRDETNREIPPERFQFNDTILICGLEPLPGTENINGTFFELEFELQVRTLSMFAWSQATHDLSYKAPEVDWRRFRLASQLRAMAEQTDLMYARFEEAISFIKRGKWDEGAARAQIVNSVNEWTSDGLLPDEAKPRNMAQFAESTIKLARQLQIEPTNLQTAVRDYIATNGYPQSLTLPQLWLGVALGLSSVYDSVSS